MYTVVAINLQFSLLQNFGKLTLVTAIILEPNLNMTLPLLTEPSFVLFCFLKKRPGFKISQVLKNL